MDEHAADALEMRRDSTIARLNGPAFTRLDVIRAHRHELENRLAAFPNNTWLVITTDLGELVFARDELIVGLGYLRVVGYDKRL